MASSKKSVENMTAEDSAAFDCGVCKCPLKPPIFQCEVGHLVCSECRDKMAAAETCHVCRRALAGGYKRCYGAEHIVECLRVPCPNRVYGCSVMLALYGESAHLQACQYRPFHCPSEGCTFVTGTMPALREHFVGTHRWPSTAVYDGSTSALVLVDGFNLIKPYPKGLFEFHLPVYFSGLVLLKVTRESYGRVVTPIHIRPRNPKKFRLKLAYETPCVTRRLEYAFNLPSTDLSDSGRLSSLDDFVVPKSLLPLDLDTIEVACTCLYPEDLES